MDAQFTPTDWSDDEIIARAAEIGLTVSPKTLPGIRANLALLQDRWATVAAALAEIDA